MTSTEVAIRQPDTIAVTERDIVDGWIQVVGETAKLADYIAETDFVPKQLRNRPAAVAACILTGRELGIGPMASLKSIHMVQGVPSLSAEYKRARAMAAGHEIVIDETNGTRCIMRGRRAGSDRWLTVTWTLDMAKRAKLAGKDVWQQYPQRMLQARASSELCDLLFPDAALGLETTEVLEDGGEGVIYNMVTGDAVPAIEAEPAGPAKPRTAQRRQRQQPADRPAAPASGAPSRPARSSAPATAAGSDMPPLPGEDEQPRVPTVAQIEEIGAAFPDGAPVPDERDYDSPFTATPAQIGKIQTVYNSVFAFKRNEHAQLVPTTEKLLSAELGTQQGRKTHNSLSFNQARALIDVLAEIESLERRDDETPRDSLVAFLATLSPAADGGDTDGEAGE